MALLLCKRCKKAFFNSPQEETICPNCVARLKELYPVVRGFLRNNEKESYTIWDISKIMGITLGDVENMVELGLLNYGPNGTADFQKQKTKNKKTKK